MPRYDEKTYDEADFEEFAAFCRQATTRQVQAIYICEREVGRNRCAQIAALILEAREKE